jgi:hypothetical protein
MLFVCDSLVLARRELPEPGVASPAIRGFFSISRSSRSILFSRRNATNSSRSADTSPSRSPASISACLTHAFCVAIDTPRSVATRATALRSDTTQPPAHETQANIHVSLHE